MENENILLVSAPDMVDAEVWRGILDAEGIPAFVQERNPLGAAIGLYTGMTGTIYDLFVDEKFVAKARTVLEANESVGGMVSDEELTRAAEEMFDERV